VVLIEILNSETSSLNIIKTIAEKYPDVKILVFSMYTDERFGVRALKAGASGFLTKHAGSKEIVAAVITIMKGNRYIEASLSESISLKAKSKYYFLSHEKLSGREYEVLRMMASGKRMSEIAAELSLSINTVSTYRARIFEKMNMRTTAELIRYVIEHNLFS
jgi:DNA-binding NarL/FixJ family response regulator